jgi:hypothetical protein
MKVTFATSVLPGEDAVFVFNGGRFAARLFAFIPLIDALRET